MTSCYRFKLRISDPREGNKILNFKLMVPFKSQYFKLQFYNLCTKRLIEYAMLFAEYAVDCAFTGLADLVIA